jgi:hypothetical protein
MGRLAPLTTSLMPKLKPVTGTIDLISESWRNFAQHFKLYVEFTAWSVALGLFLWLLTSILANTVADTTYLQITLAFVSIPFWIGYSLLALGLISATWKSLNGETPTLMAALNAALHHLARFIWLSVLTGALFLVIPGSILSLLYLGATLSLPVISQSFFLYLVVALVVLVIGLTTVLIPLYYLLPLSFTANHLMLEEKGAWACIKRAAALVKGRWWTTLWRLAVPGVFFWLVTHLALYLTHLLLGAIFGDIGLFFGTQNGNDSLSLLQTGLKLVSTETLYGLAAPLFLAANLLVWHGLNSPEQK